jgi:hypothetical protein
MVRRSRPALIEVTHQACDGADSRQRPVTSRGWSRIVSYGRPSPPSLVDEAVVATRAAVEWKIAIEGTDIFGEVCRHEIRIDKSWDRLFDREIGLSVEDGKKIMAALRARDPSLLRDRAALGA